MPAQLSSILYISDVKEKVSSEFLILKATGYTRIGRDAYQKYNMTAFYPLDNDKPCYLPKLKDEQVLSISNSKFNKAENGELDLILTSASILNITSEELPPHQITVVGVATATDAARTTEIGVSVECLISDYFSKDKLIELPITLVHPTGSRFTNQTSTIKRGSLIFFSGGLTMIEEELYLELQNFSFVRNTSSTKQMPWASKSSPGSFTPSSNIAQSMHKLNKKTSNSANPVPATLSNTPTNITKSMHKYKKSSNLDDNPISKPPTIETERSDDTITQNDHFPNLHNKIPQTPKRKTRSSISKSPTIETEKSDDAVIVQDDHLPNLPPTPTSLKRKTRSSYKTSNKAQKLADIATNIIAVADSDPEDE